MLHKKRKSRTEVSSPESSDNDSESINSCRVADEKNEDKRSKDLEPHKLKKCVAKKAAKKPMTDNEVSTAFAEFYLKKVTDEFSDDLDQLRNAEDFKEDSIPILISALQQGTSLFPIEEQRRIVLAGQEIEEEKEE